jgi:hypothetical protein
MKRLIIACIQGKQKKTGLYYYLVPHLYFLGCWLQRSNASVFTVWIYICEQMDSTSYIYSSSLSFSLSLSIADGIWYVSFYFFFFFVRFFEFGTGRSRPCRTMRTAYQQHTIPAIEKERDRERCGTLIYTKILNRVVDVYHSPARELLPMFAHW